MKSCWKRIENKKISAYYQVGCKAVAMIIGIVPEMEEENEGNRKWEIMEFGTTWYICGATLHRTGHAEKVSIVMLLEIRIPRGHKFRDQWEFRRKYPEYDCYIAAAIDIDLVADMDSDQVPSDGHNDERAHITIVTFLTNVCFTSKHLW